MKAHTTIMTIIAAALMFASCSEDLNIEPETDIVETSFIFEEEYLLAIRAETELTATDFCDGPQCSHTMPLNGSGLAFSNTFGPMDVYADLYYDMSNGRISGRMTFTIRNTDETLSISIKEKGDSRKWYELNGSCMAATSNEPFVEMNFNGDVCFEQLPDDIRSLETGHTAVILIKGQLK